ncbi:glycosyltransferase [Dietzia sp. 179-F 9C3 NHS]|uniref:glycosyltransferase n=1 Tax=Dietzia sp. 179-F 9C3 NHS TaxID=3374295 RepID=UPI00387A82E7
MEHHGHHEPDDEVGRSVAVLDSPRGRECLQRVILPRPGEPLDVRSLYLVEAPTNARRAHSGSRTTLSIGADAEVSFATYFNAFAAAYWRRWTVLESVVLRLTLRGAGRVDLYRSKIDGSRIAITGEVVGEPGAGGADLVSTVEIECDLGPFEDGGWIWFDLTSDTDVELLAAGWYSPIDAPATRPDASPEGRPDPSRQVPNDRRVTVGIPTFNRPGDAVAALRALTSDPEVDAVIDAVLMPDQGDRKVRDEPGFAEAEDLLGGRLRIFDQPNLGGSGGYSRIMYEARRLTDAPFILFMDDDIEIEPDSILRALAFGRFSTVPMLVGGQMLNLQERSHLHTMGEVVGAHDFMWTSAPHADYDYDFSRYPLTDRENPKELHRRIDVDYNGWWMCLIPRVVAEKIGQPLPLFIKWDDAEYGLRARRAGHPTVTMPGVAIWHMAWSDKDDAIDWQAYFHLRNRLVVASLYHDGDHKGIMKSSLKALVKHLVCLEYSTVAIQIEAIRDFLRGPEALYELLPSALPKVRTMRAEYPDAVVIGSAVELPAPSGAPAGVHVEPKGPVRKGLALARGLAHTLTRDDKAHHEVPQANFPPIEARWYSLSRVDGATVTTADGRGVVYRKRDRDKARALLAASLDAHRELYRRFPEMRRRYREAHAGLITKEAWSRVFES